MADFDLRVSAGVESRRWVDPVGPDGQPSRIRPHLGHDQLYFLGRVAIGIRFLMTVDAVEMPADSTLGGRLFTAYLAEGFGPPALSAAAGWSSSILWTPANPGHHVIGIRRPQGGAILVPFDIEAP
jgi:hypothetical protein